MIQYTYTQTETLNLKTSVKANFGVDADVKSDSLTFNIGSLIVPGIDDWFMEPTAVGKGVIDVSDSSQFSDLKAGKNISVEFGMSQTDNPFWIDAIYLRDYYSHNNEKDLTIFGGGDDKNFNNPTTWTIKRGSVPPKNDIIDVFGHMRLDPNEQDTSNNLWVFSAVSTRTQNGDNYIDFEYFRKPVTYTIPSNPSSQGNLKSEGKDCGHTAYKFDLLYDANGDLISDGKVLEDGDIILSVNYINGGAKADFRFYAWIDSDEIKALDGDPSSLSDADFIFYNKNIKDRRFDFGYGIGEYETYNYEFYNCNNDSSISYGYARISLKKDNNIIEPIVAQDNTLKEVGAPLWGTIGSDGNVNFVYESPAFIEFALNASLLGLDSTSSSNNCSQPPGTVIVKTRASASFTSELKDLAGPFTLGATPKNTITISEPEILTCSVIEITITATISSDDVYTYEWFKEGQPFDDATPGNNTLTVTEPGQYLAKVAFSEECKVQSNEVVVLQNIIKPTVTAKGGEIDCASGQVQLNGLMSSTNPNADLIFEWSGPNNYVNITEINPFVTLEGTYTLTISDNNNGCISSAIAEVTSDPASTFQIECPSMIEVQCREDIPEPDINTIVIINGGEGGSPLVQFVNDVSDNGSCPEIITRTYSATDTCGNIVYCSQIITVNDTTKPVIAAVPNAISVQCIEDVPAQTSLNWTDNCDVGGSVLGVDGPLVGGECGGTITRTWNVKDACQNAAVTRIQIITVNDTVKPEILDLPDYTMYSCYVNWPEFLTTTWTDNCSGSGEIVSDNGGDDGSSEDGLIIYRKYTFEITDACGNQDIETTRVSLVIDSIPLEIECPPMIEVQCIKDVPEADINTVVIISGSGSGLTVQFVSDVSDNGSCPQVITRTYSANDGCGHIVYCTQIITVNDTIHPEISDLVDYKLEGCNTEWPPYLTTTWTDNCTTGGNIDSDSGVDGPDSTDGCQQTRVYTFNITDDCGNPEQETTTVTRDYDMTNPEIVDKDDFTLEGCNSEWPEYLTTTWTDNCAEGGDIDSDNGTDLESSTDGTMEYREYKFSVTDTCGNTDTETTVVSRLFSNGEKVIGDYIEFCKDYENYYNLFDLLPPDGYVPGGSWSLFSSPEDTDIEIDSGIIYISEELIPGNYIFHYKQGSEECLPLIEVTVNILEDINCVLPCSGGELSTALTPNGDNVNDTFKAGLSQGGSCKVDVQIFNRWGAKIFEAQDYQNDWSGTVSSNAIGSATKITTGTYYYIIKYKLDGKVEQTLTGYFYAAIE